MNYWKVLDGYLKDPTLSDLSGAKLVTVSGSEESTAILDQIQGYHDRGIVLKGNRLFRDVIVTTPEMDSELGLATVSYCHDVKSLAPYDSLSGKKVDVPSIPTVEEKALLEMGLDEVWRISAIQNQDSTC